MCQHVSPSVAPHDGTVKQIICPQSEAPVSNGKEILAEGGISLNVSDWSMMSLEPETITECCHIKTGLSLIP